MEATPPPRPLRVLMDYRPARFGRGGIAVYTRELAGAYARAFPDDPLSLWAFRLRRPTPGHDASSGGAPRDARLLAGPVPSRLVTALGRAGWGSDVLAGGVDVVHWTDYVELPVRRAAVVATVHDLLFETLPDCYTSAMRRGLAAVTRRIVRRADRILVPSEATRAALVARHGVSGASIDVVSHGVAPLPPARPAHEHGCYVLFVGTLEPRKNLARLLAAHALARRRVADLRLVVAGSRGWLDDGLVAALSSHAGVTWEGAVSRERLASLYLGARALAYPSLGEGFGLPVLEAMAEGLPVLVGRGTTCADLAGDAALAVDPHDVDALAEGLARLAEDEAFAARLGVRGRSRAANYTWARAARATRAAYARAVHERAARR